jgi:tellurite resistance protein TerC
MHAQFAGASLAFWIAFHAIVALLLVVDLLVLGRAKDLGGKGRVRQAWAWTAVLAAVAFCFALYVSHEQGHERAVEFVSGYLVEGSLSVDNLFIFLLLFRSLGLSVDGQRRVLLWGVLGAIVLRAICIFAGVALLGRFASVQYVFGVVLLYAGLRLLRAKHDGASEKQQPGPMRWLRGRVKNTGGGELGGSSFLLVVLAVEATDLLFALDSIPAVLAITRDPFIVYTSNIFAILGLRSLYFGLAGMLDKLRLLHYGLAVILIFVAVKMLAAKWVEVPAWISLLVILTILGGFALASRLLPARREIA